MYSDVLPSAPFKAVTSRKPEEGNITIKGFSENQLSFQNLVLRRNVPFVCIQETHCDK